MFKEFIVSLQMEPSEIPNERIADIVATSFMQNCTDHEQLMHFKKR